jgi:hypothetical protein
MTEDIRIHSIVANGKGPSVPNVDMQRKKNEQGMEDFARQVAAYYTALIGSGMTAEAALELTLAFQESFVATVFGKK